MRTRFGDDDSLPPKCMSRIQSHSPNLYKVIWDTAKEKMGWKNDYVVIMLPDFLTKIEAVPNAVLAGGVKAPCPLHLGTWI